MTSIVSIAIISTREGEATQTATASVVRCGVGVVLVHRSRSLARSRRGTHHTARGRADAAISTAARCSRATPPHRHLTVVVGGRRALQSSSSSIRTFF